MPWYTGVTCQISWQQWSEACRDDVVARWTERNLPAIPACLWLDEAPNRAGWAVLDPFQTAITGARDRATDVAVQRQLDRVIFLVAAYLSLVKPWYVGQDGTHYTVDKWTEEYKDIFLANWAELGLPVIPEFLWTDVVPNMAGSIQVAGCQASVCAILDTDSDFRRGVYLHAAMNILGLYLSKAR